MSKKLNDVLSAHGLNIGLSNADEFTGTWEWYEIDTEEFRAGFATAEDAYMAAAAHLKETSGIEIPELNEDGELVSMP